ncbi:MAG: serine hydrolase domain-containing protein [bacterium]
MKRFFRPSARCRFSGRISKQLFIFAAILFTVPAWAKPLPLGSPEKADVSAERLAKVDGVIEAAIENGNLPGGVLVVGRHGKIVYQKAYGNRAVEPEKEPTTLDTIYDMASLTKVIATTTAMMTLAEQGKLRFDDPVRLYVPQFDRKDKRELRLRHLLTHSSGLPAWDKYFEKFPERHARAKIIDDIASKTLSPEPGKEFRYSDLNFITLGQVVETVSGENLDEYTHRMIFGPLGMNDTRFNPPEELWSRCAPTEKRDGKFIRGQVHDGNAWVQDGLSGHAGLFSTGSDLAIFAQMLLDKGQYGGVRILSPATVKAMTRPQLVLEGKEMRGYGWDIGSPYSSLRGDFMPAGGFGHTGWTGTSIWVSPQLDCFVIFLSNAIHPAYNESKGVVRLRALISNVVVSSIER